jgi:hypothetical protein
LRITVGERPFWPGHGISTVELEPTPRSNRDH